VAIDCYDGEIIRERSMFPWWNHWPVAQQIRSNGRWAVAPDRVSHSSLTHIQSWKPHAESDNGLTMVMLNGLTAEGVGGLLPIAKSWLNPPSVKLRTSDYEDHGFDRTERAFVLARRQSSGKPLDLVLEASAEAPIVNPAFLVKNWGDRKVRVRVDGQLVAESKDLRSGITHRLDGADLVVWVRRTSSKPTRFTLEQE
jgi:hypothetical protein